MARSIFCLALLLILGFAVQVFAAPAADIADIQAPVGMAYDADGALYVAEWGAGRVSKFDRAGARMVVAENIRQPAGLAFDDRGVLYVASYGDGGIYALEPGSAPRRIASGFSSPTGLLWDGDSLVVANRNAGEVVRVFLDGRKKVISRGHRTPVGIAKLTDGSWVVSCYGGSVDMVSPEGNVSTLTTSLSPGAGIIPDGGPDGEEAVLVANYGGNTVERVTRDGKSTLAADGPRAPVGLARMPDGRIIVGAWGDNAAYIFTPEK